MLRNPEAVESYQWKIYSYDLKKYTSDKKSDSPKRNVYYTGPGKNRIEGIVLSDGSPVATLSMDQTVVAEDAFLKDSLVGQSAEVSKTYREVVNDFKSYIIDAANSTGSMGITPRMLASVLMIEIGNRPKEGRMDELEDVDSDYKTLQSGGSIWFLDYTDKSVGVGQVKPSTAAMVTGKTPWIDQKVNDKETSREEISNNFKGLGLGSRYNLFEQLRFPKSNIMMAAKLLAKLKNRSNRFPTLSKTEFVADEHAVKVIATEYNLGATDSKAKDAQPSSYGQWTWDYLTTDPIIINYFPNE